MRTTKSISYLISQILHALKVDLPEFLSPKELHELPKLSNLAEGSMFLMSFSISPRTLFHQLHPSDIKGGSTDSSLTVSSSLVGKRGRTKVNNDDDRSVRNLRCKTPGCILDCGVLVIGDGDKGLMSSKFSRW